VSSVEFTRTDLNVQALAQGTIQFANSQVMDPVRATQKGAKLAFIMENNGGEFLMVAKNDIKDCKDTDGKRFADPWRSGDHLARGQTMAAQRL
jgi:ABC-type nitrate/sulfonate/bicarbonate transport system substrate-binding protein